MPDTHTQIPAVSEDLKMVICLLVKKHSLFLLNTDGISSNKKPKLTIWPVFLVINELPLEIRFLIDNTILAGNAFSLILIYLIEYFI